MECGEIKRILYVGLECKRAAESAIKQEVGMGGLAAGDTSGRWGARVVVFNRALQVTKYRWEAQSSPIGNKLGRPLSLPLPFASP
jgi:hypothetical protein